MNANLEFFAVRLTADLRAAAVQALTGSGFSRSDFNRLSSHLAAYGDQAKGFGLDGHQDVSLAAELVEEHVAESFAEEQAGTSRELTTIGRRSSRVSHIAHKIETALTIVADSAAEANA